MFSLAKLLTSPVPIRGTGKPRERGRPSERMRFGENQGAGGPWEIEMGVLLRVDPPGTLLRILKGGPAQRRTGGDCLRRWVAEPSHPTESEHEASLQLHGPNLQ